MISFHTSSLFIVSAAPQACHTPVHRAFLVLFLFSFAASEHFLFPVACHHHGKPTSSSWNSPSSRGSKARGPTNQCTANAAAKLFTGSGRQGLLCSASIKGNSAEDFLVEVMRPTITHRRTHTQRLAEKEKNTHKHIMSYTSAHKLTTSAHLSKAPR